MGWTKLEDTFAAHPKLMNVSLEARWAFIESLCYTARYETDGVLPETVAANGPIREELMRVGLWESGTASVLIHDYTVYNRSRSEKEQTRNRMRTVRALSPNGKTDERSSSGSKASNPSGFELFWSLYPRKVGKAKARSAFDRATRTVREQNIIEGTRKLAADPNLPETQFIPHPTTWLAREGWEDEPFPSKDGRSGGGAWDREAE